jgi:microsomal prostaglandin-E synthase 2
LSFLGRCVNLAFFLSYHHPGGSKPNLADLAVFGVLRPIRYLRSGKDMVEHTQIGEWYQRMEDAVGEPSRIEEGQE